MSVVTLSEMLGASVRDASGAVRGRVREVAVVPQDHPTRLAFLVVKTGEGERLVPGDALTACGPTIRAANDSSAWEQYVASDGVLLLKRDLLDQQIIDVYGRKVVRVNDVELDAIPVGGQVAVNVVAVDVGARGAIRRLAKGAVPSFTLRALLEKIPPRVIPWQYVDLLETDPARRVKLKIAYGGLATLHPADIADIVEDLPPAERESVFETLDEEVAAEALEEIDPDIQVSIVESLDRNRAADIVEEMDPDAAADLLGDLTEDHSGEILREMEPEERREVTQLLEFGEHTAAGRMTTEYLAVPETSVVDDAIDALKAFEGSREAVATIYLTGAGQKLVGSVPLVKIAISSPAAQLSQLSEPYISCPPDTPQDEVAALFDKYNLITLAVVDEHGRLAGIITADDVITMLRHN
ncbi:MAG TPA: CBS domain-containing protein [Vicinamibacterales bacterium]|jgi:CBS domain-containing protein|nr:CBS domain-containing protein [Vicinamibacterales bacterium]